MKNGGGGGSRTYAPILTKWPILTEITNNYECLKKRRFLPFVIINHQKSL